MRTAIYPGSFDPITNGHVDIIQRGVQLFDQLYIVLSHNVNKRYLLTLEERVELTKEAVAHLNDVQVVVSENMLSVDFAKSMGAIAIFRGLRSVTDFEYEFAMAMANRKLAPHIETVFLTADPTYTYLSSSVIKEIAKFDGDVSDFVPTGVAHKLKTKFDD
ncbi:MAG: pantetheine-phosphate adenylyltransferase [Defluviitaleaceae bacterium]|nr:pantetheine-phosphate adenylyltransferase [Defluviitaleaceae bacterium]